MEAKGERTRLQAAHRAFVEAVAAFIDGDGAGAGAGEAGDGDAAGAAQAEVSAGR